MLVMAAALTVLPLVVDPTQAAGELPVAAILDEVRAIWRPYVTILVARESPGSVSLKPTLHLRFNDAAPPDAKPEALGWIDFVDGVPSPRITVSRAQARLLLARADWSGRPVTNWPEALGREALTRTLARTAAHEIGHFFLRSTTHRTEGLMRGSPWTTSSIRGANASGCHVRTRRRSPWSAHQSCGAARPDRTRLRRDKWNDARVSVGWPPERGFRVTPGVRF